MLWCVARSAGDLLVAVTGALVFTVGVVAWWARIVEPRLFAARDRRPSPAELIVATHDEPDRDDHLAFAQALALVADRYLAECQRQAVQRPPTHPGAAPR
jgi:hypothetical protein